MPANSDAAGIRPTAVDGLPSLIGSGPADLAAAALAAGAPEAQARLRGRQLFHWIYARGAADFAPMTDLPAALRQRLGELYSVARPEIVAEQRAADGTWKWLLRFADGKEGKPHRGREIGVRAKGAERIAARDDQRLCALQAEGHARRRLDEKEGSDNGIMTERGERFGADHRHVAR